MPHKSAWKKRLLELEEQKKREEQIPQIIGGSRHVLILTADHRLYGLGSNDGGQLGTDNIGNVESPQLLAENVCSAAVMSEPFYTVYVTEHGSVKLIGNGEYADRFGGFENAREVFTQAGVFWIQDLRVQRLAHIRYKENFSQYLLWDYLANNDLETHIAKMDAL